MLFASGIRAWLVVVALVVYVVVLLVVVLVVVILNKGISALRSSACLCLANSLYVFSDW